MAPAPRTVTAPGLATPPRSPSSPSPTYGSPHTTYQSFADLPPSPVTPTTAHSRRFIASRKDNQRDHVEPWSAHAGATDGAAISPGQWRSVDEEDDEADELGRNGQKGGTEAGGKKLKKTSLSKAELIKMTVGIAGAQLAWTVEMAYGTPYLLSLGLSKQGTSLVWMAGPLSGLIVQPVVGALSDSSPSRFRRRQYILLSTLLIVLATLVVAFALPFAGLITSLLPFDMGGHGDWDPENGEIKGKVAIALGVGGFYALDFALNGLQASLRALVLDLSPPGTHSTSNAYLGLQTHLANIVGYLLGYSDLSHSPLLRWMGGGQFRRLALVACAVMAACVGVTCVTQEEERRVRREGEEDEGQESAWKKLKGVVSDVARNLKELPTPVKRVCYVQFFNWTAWFPFLFYSTTYISESLYASRPPSTPGHPRNPPSADEATRLGSFALLLYALVSLFSSILIPYVTTLGTHYPSLPRRVGPLGRFVLSKLTPRKCWTVGLVWYAVLMASTFWIKGVKGSMAIVTLAGVPWAITCWVPFALVMEAIRDLETGYDAAEEEAQAASHQPASPAADDLFSSPRRAPSRNFRTPFRAAASLRQASFTVPPAAGTAASSSRESSVAASPARGHNRNGGSEATERTALLANGESGVKDGSGGEGGELGGRKRQRPSGGTLLGIHNLAVVLPQFFVAVVAAIIFHFTSAPPSTPSPSGPSNDPSFSPLLSFLFTSPPPSAGTQGTNDVVWVLRFGGLFALLGALVSASGKWGLVETGSERRYRWYVLEGWREEGDQEEGRDSESEA
ncbi:hypothetical protein JCM11251_007290 [Rhodosporidiobolus azoricus]